MHGPINAQMVDLLARNAGFEFSLDRCELLVPQLDWLLAQGELLSGLNLGSEEPLLIMRLNPFATRVDQEPENG